MDAESESDLKLKRTQARGKATKLLKNLAECGKTKDSEDDLALIIHHIESHIQLMTKLQVCLDKFSVYSFDHSALRLRFNYSSYCPNFRADFYLYRDGLFKNIHMV